MKLTIFGFSILSGVFLFSGCLKTREEVKEVEQRQVMLQQVSTLQKTNADVASRFDEVQDEIRQLNGRVEVVENQIQKQDQKDSKSNANLAEQLSETQKRQGLLQESLTKMEQQLMALQNELVQLKSAESSAAKSATTKAKTGKASFDEAQEFFSQKDWKKAIVSFQKYRDDNPKGKNFLEATYKIGLSFQELGMREEARNFYDEVISKFPKSEEATKAKKKIKSLK